ncbi:MAG: sulfatase/phosphatase domain-containing protein, partial [Armatimonadota bacterium]
GATPFRRWKRETYRGGVSDPCIVSWPSRISAAGEVRSQYSHAIDVAPTILDAAGLGFADEVDGASLVPLGTDTDADWREDVVCETHGHGEEHLGRAVMADRYKYVANKGQMDELYDLAEDPYEMVNLIGDPAHGDVLSEMQQRLSRWQESTSDPHSVMD